MWAAAAKVAIIRFAPKDFILWTIVLILAVQGYLLYTAASGSVLPFGWNIPKVPFVACGSTTAPATVPPPDARSVSYAAGAGLRDLRDNAVDAAKVTRKLVGFVRWVGSVVGSFSAGNDGGPPPEPRAPKFPVMSTGLDCGTCPGVAPDVVLAGQAAHAAGFTGRELVTAVAVAGAESGYRPEAANKRSSARGLFQIMQSVHRDKLVGEWSDPFASATVARKVWEAAGGSWSPWVGYTSGAYKQHLPEAEQVAACATSASLVSGRAAVVIAAARTYLGTPYRFGGTSRAGIDCSGLTQAAFKAAGVSLPRVSADQMRAGTPVPMDQLQAGDLVGFDNSSRNVGADHIALALGGGLIIEAARPGTVVRVRPLLPSEGGTAVRILG